MNFTQHNLRIAKPINVPQQQKHQASRRPQHRCLEILRLIKVSRFTNVAETFYVAFGQI